MATRVREALADQTAVEEKSMFGSLGFIVNGKLTVCVQASSLMYKLSPADAAAAIGQGTAEMAVMGKRTMKNWVVLSNDTLANTAQFDRLLKQSLQNTDEK